MTELIEQKLGLGAEQDDLVAELPRPEPETVTVFDIPKGDRRIEAQLAAMAFGFM